MAVSGFGGGLGGAGSSLPNLLIEHQVPFEEEYQDDSLYFLARTLECGVVTEARQIPMRQVGSDENYLTLHVSMLVAFHRFFRSRKSPVPGVLLFDQLSRPYFPPERRPEEVTITKDTEAGALKQYFDFLIDEAKRQKDLQIIVLEHAYFATDKRFLEAVRERWNDSDKKLIPSDWPRAS